MSTAPHKQTDGNSSRPRLRLTVPSFSTTRLSTTSPKEKLNVQPPSGRGGLGNVRAAMSQKSETESPAQPPALSLPLLSPNSPSESGSSGASLYSTSTGSDRRSIAGTLRSKFTSNRSTACLVSSDASAYESGYCAGDSRSELGSSMSMSLRGTTRDSVFSSNSVNTFGIPLVPRSPISPTPKPFMLQQRRSDTSSEYSRDIIVDAASRAAKKRLQAASRQRISHVNRCKTSQTDKLRTGRGGAGVFTNVKNNVNADLFPTTAALTREHEARLVAQERLVVEAARARSAMVRKTGRGGAGNFNNAKGRRKLDCGDAEAGDRKSVAVSVRKSGKAKGQGRQTKNDKDFDADEHEGSGPAHGHRRSGSASSHSGSMSRRQFMRTKSTLRIQQRKGLSKLWSHVSSVRNKGQLSKTKGPIEFEIVELKVENHCNETISPVSPGPDVTRFGPRSPRSTGANRALALARLERRSERPRLLEVPEEDDWVDEGRVEVLPNRIALKEVKNEPTSPPTDVAHSKNKERRMSRSSDVSRHTTSSTRGTLNNPTPHTNARAFHDCPVSRDSVGTFGPRGDHEESQNHDGGSISDDDDVAESIVDPYLHDG